MNSMRTALFWVIMQWIVVIAYRCFRTTSRFQLQGEGHIGCPKTSARNYHPEEHSSHLLHSGSLKSCGEVQFFGMIVTNENCIHTGVKNWLHLKKVCYHSVQNLYRILNILTTHLLSENVKFNIQFFPDAGFSHVRSLIFQAHQNSCKNNVTSPHVKIFPIVAPFFYFCADISNLICAECFTTLFSQ